MFSVSLLRRQLRLHWQWGVWGREKGKKCAGVACQKSRSVDRFLHPCGLMTRPGVPWGFSSHKLLQVQSPRKIFLHSNVPIWRQASALWVLQSCFYALFIRNVCCLNLDSVVFHSDVCLASFLLFFKCLLSMTSFSRSAASKACLQAPLPFPSPDYRSARFARRFSTFPLLFLVNVRTLMASIRAKIRVLAFLSPII